MTPNDGSPGYPSYRKVDVALRSGATVRIRPVVPEDIGDLQDLFARLSGESSRKRFHGMHHPSEAELRRFAEVDYRDRFGLVAETSMGDGPRVVALASYIRTG